MEKAQEENGGEQEGKGRTQPPLSLRYARVPHCLLSQGNES